MYDFEPCDYECKQHELNFHIKRGELWEKKGIFYCIKTHKKEVNKYKWNKTSTCLRNMFL